MQKPEVDALALLFSAGRFAEAESAARKITLTRPDDAFGWKVLGSVLGRTYRSAEAVPILEKARALLPTDAEVHNNLGNALGDLGRFAEAEECYRRALALTPDNHEAHTNLANTLMALGRLAEAEASCRRALALMPRFHVAHNSLGCVLQQQGRLPEAEASFRHALTLKPDFVLARKNLGPLLKHVGRLVEAEASYREVLKARPDDHETLADLGTVLLELGRLQEAEASLRKALRIKPDDHVAHNNLGNTLRLFGRLMEAEASYRRALAEKPGWYMAHNNLGCALIDFGRTAEAESSLQRALELAPDIPAVHSNLLFLLNYDPDRTAEQIFEEYRRFDARFGQPLRQQWTPHGNVRSHSKRLRVGYFSPDFRKHSARHLIEPVLAQHDRSSVELFAYAEVTAEDEVTARMKSQVEHWTATSGMTDGRLAEHIRRDGIDILVDLSGHTYGNRLPVFARKPAPVSLSMFGFGYTTGLTAIDWYLTDAVCAPPGCEALFAEGVWRLSRCIVYRPAEGMGDPGPLPAVRRGHVTFGTLTRALRINHRTIRSWAELLRRVPGSRLRIDSISMQTSSVGQSLIARFGAHGIPAARLELGFHSPPWDVLREIDLTLDCFPHNSGTTLLESLYLGVPVVTLAGRPSVGRLGASIVAGAGHPEWIAADEADYVNKAVALAGDLPALAGLRARLRGELQGSPLMDERGFVRELESAYREMWRRWCSS